jgi:hypothetical protein
VSDHSTWRTSKGFDGAYAVFPVVSVTLRESGSVDDEHAPRTNSRPKQARWRVRITMRVRGRVRQH